MTPLLDSDFIASALRASKVSLVLSRIFYDGNLSSRDELLTVAGTIAIFFAPALIASAFRPFRREIRNSADKWERLTDYLHAAVLTGWSISKMIGSLSSLASIQLSITIFSFNIGAIAAVAVAVRLAGEDCAIYMFLQGWRHFTLIYHIPVHFKCHSP